MAIGAKEMQRAFAIAVREHDAEQIEKSFEEPARSEFGFSELARVMRNRNFRYAETLPIRKRGKETMGYPYTCKLSVTSLR